MARRTNSRSLTLATSRLDRRWLFLGLLGVVTLANVFAAVSPNYTALAVMRVITALTHGVFWSILAAFATRVAPKMPTGRALAWAFGGISLAIVAGVPSANAIGQWAGWRVAFGTLAALGLVTIIAGGRWLPSVAADPRTFARASLPGDTRLYGVVSVTALIVAAHFCGYTYIVPLLDRVIHASKSDIPLLLLLFGSAGALGTAIAGWLGERPIILALFAAIGIVTSQALMALGGDTPSLAWLEMALWGASISVLIIGLQGWVFELVPKQADAGSALYVAAFNLGIGAGAMVGGLVLEAGNERAVLWTGITLGTMACAALAMLVPCPVRAKVQD
jgi:DHA1 family L-arabinose/isopropyl-beta-D-thiogalactopyranoside export protein-like MFS transporter